MKRRIGELETAALKTLVPIHVFTPEKFDEFVAQIEVEREAAGHALFRRGDTDNRVVYLLAGVVQFLDQDGNAVQTVRSGTEQARYPLAHHIPRDLTAVARSEVAFARVQTRLLDALLEDKESVDYRMASMEVTELADADADAGGQEGDWMTRALRSTACAHLPPSNLQALFMRLRPMAVRQGDVVIRQGDEPNYYYFVQRGRCRVTRESPERPSEVLAEFAAGDGFGEEALITREPRNATVTMLSDGMLMRLSRGDFEELMKQPLVHWVSAQEAGTLVDNGAVWLDVRMPAEYEASNIPGSVNAPLSRLRQTVAGLDIERSYIAYSDHGRRAAVAAFLLSQRGFEARVLEVGHDDRVGHKPAHEPREASTVQRSAAQLKQAFDQQERELLTLEARADQESRKRREAEAEVERLKQRQEIFRHELEDHIRRHRKAESEAQQVRDQAEAARDAAQREAARLADERRASHARAEEALRRLQQDREDLRVRAEEEAGSIRSEAEALRSQAAREAEQLRSEAQAAVARAESEAERIKREEELLLHELEEQAKWAHRAEDAEMRQAEGAAGEILAEAERERLQAEHEAARLRAEAERMRLDAEEEATRLRAELEQLRLKAEEEAARMVAEAQELRIQAMREIAANARDEAARVDAEARAARIEADAADRIKARVEQIRRAAHEQANAVTRQAEDLQGGQARETADVADD